MRKNLAKRHIIKWIIIIILAVMTSVTCSPSTQPESSPPTLTKSSLTTDQEISMAVSASEGGELTLPDETLLKIPPGSLQEDTQVSLLEIEAEDISTMPQELIVVGNVYDVDLGTNELEKPAILEIPFDPTLLPSDAEPSQVFLSYYDENTKEWVYAGGEVDTTRNVVILKITHASWWMPTTWNWEAWIAVLNKVLQFSIVNWIEAVQLLTDDCPQTGEYVQVNSSQARNVVQGCIERDKAERLGLRVVNPKSFFFEVRPISGGNGYPITTLLSPGQDLEFEAFTSDPSPLIIEAQMTEKSGWYLVIHMVITMLPGANQFGIQGRHVACITERLADVSYFASASESLLIDHNGASAAESISQFMLDSNAMRRFITAADDCNFGPAPTWSLEGIRQIGGAVSTIMSATDYIANYLAGNTSAQISFVWISPSPVYSKAQISFWENLFLTYDPAVWEAVPALTSHPDQKNDAGEYIQQLRHKIYSECVLRDNLGVGVPGNWQREDYDEQIGNLVYQVEEWVDTNTGQPVLVIHHYPPGNWENNHRIELTIQDHPEACRSDAEKVIALSEADIKLGH